MTKIGGTRASGNETTTAAVKQGQTPGKSTLVGGHATAAPGQTGSSAPSIEALREAIGTRSRDAAVAAFKKLDQAGRLAMRQDLALIGAYFAVIDGPSAMEALRELRLDRRSTLKVAGFGRATDFAFLTEVLHLLGLDKVPKLAEAASDLVTAPAFAPLLPAILNGPTATAQLQLKLATSPNGIALLHLAFHGQSVLTSLQRLAFDSRLLLEGYKTNSAFAAWLISDAERLEISVTSSHDGLAWGRAMFGRHESVLLGWLLGNKTFWGTAFAAAMQTPLATDLAALRAHVRLQWAIFDAISSVKPVEMVVKIFGAFKLSIADKVNTLVLLNRLDDHALQLTLHDPHLTASDLDVLTDDDAALGWIKKLSKGKRPSQVFQPLAREPVKFCAAIGRGGVFTKWATETEATVIAEMKAVVDTTAWVAALKAVNDARSILAAAADATLQPQIRAALVATTSWNWFFQTVPHPVPTQKQVDAIFALYGADGAGIGLQEHYTMWAALYHTPLERQGNDYVEHGSMSPGFGVWERRYIGVNPNDATMKGFFKIFRLMPRAHIDTAKAVLFCRVHTFKRTVEVVKPDKTKVQTVDYFDTATKLYVPNVVEIDIGPSFYGNDNRVVMKATNNAGDHNSGVIGTNYVGMAGEKAGAVNKLDGQATDMTYFQNHATHEVGHSVANRTLKRGKYNTTGNEFGKDYGQWKVDGKAIDYARMLEFTDALDKQDFVISVARVRKTYRGQEIREFLMGIVEGGLASQNSHKIARDFGDAGRAVTALKANTTLAGNLLCNTVSELRDQFPGGGWQFPHGIGAATTRVTMRADGKWQTYHASVWRNRVSHYSIYSVGENFAEMYTARYASKKTPPAIDGLSIDDFFTELTNADPAELGLEAAKGGRSPGATPDAAAGAAPPVHRPFP